MKLKRMNTYLDLMSAVQACKGNVYFNSPEGDHLNLKSTFCQYLFASVCGDQDFLTQGDIVCGQESDYKKLQEYLAGPVS